MKSTLFIVLSATFLGLGSCNYASIKQATPSMSPAVKIVRLNHTELRVPAELIVHPSANPHEHRVIDNDFNDNDLDQPNEYRIEITTFSDTGCPPSLTGISNTPVTTLTGANGLATWGRVDFGDDGHEVKGSDIKPLCVSPVVGMSPSERPKVDCSDLKYSDEVMEYISECESRQRQYEKHHGMFAAFALCSEGNGKTVLVCITQMTDNPDLAKEIFETFRWTK